MQYLADHEVDTGGDLYRQRALDAVGNLLADVDGIVHETAHVLDVVGHGGQRLTFVIEGDILAVDAVGQNLAKGLLHLVGVNRIHDGGIAVVTKAEQVGTLDINAGAFQVAAQNPQVARGSVVASP